MADIVWTPPRQMADGSALANFATGVGIAPANYDALHRWSVADPGAFWSAVWDFAGIIGDKGDVTFAADRDRWMTGAAFFPAGRLNLAENLLRRTGDEIVVVETDERNKERTEISADNLRAKVARVAEGLRAAGVGPGDRVAVVLPNRVQCLVTLLATATVGAVWTSCSPDFGTAAIVDRIGQVRPKVLFAQAKVHYGGRDYDISDRLSEIAGRLEGLHQVVLIGDGDIATDVPVAAFDEFGSAAPLTFERVGFNDPVYILYTSGTTGAPKAIVHRTGGVLLQKVKEHLLHSDVRPGDRVMWYTNTAWMMYHWVIAALACHARLVLYDGAPILKAPEGLDGSPLWRVVEKEGLTHLGISPKYVSTLMDSQFVPNAGHEVSGLRWLLSAGSPVPPQMFDWIGAALGKHVGFASISGGTEIMGCFLLGSPRHPVRRGMLTVKGLGMAVNVVDDRGAPVIGRPGELVCTEPFPSMPLTFWGEGGAARYHDTYFSQRPEIWTHGDLAQMNADGTAVIFGRSDFTLNPGGVRIGTADIYNVCERFPEIEDSIVFGRQIPGDEEIVLCLKPTAGSAIAAEVALSLRQAIREECSPRHVPAAIYLVADVPYTINGKRVEGAARAVVAGGEVKNLASLANPECLDEFARLDAKVAL